MDFWTWLAFVGTVTGLLIVPGPTLLLLVALASRHGRRAIPYFALGIASAEIVFIFLGLGGVAAIIAASPLAFWILRSISLIYVAYLVWHLWVSDLKQGPASDFQPDQPNQPGLSRWILSRHMFVTTFTNPKGLMLVFGIFPNFVSPSAGFDWQVSLILAGTFMTISALVSSTYGLLSTATFARLAGWRHGGKISACFIVVAVVGAWTLELTKTV